MKRGSYVGIGDKGGKEVDLLCEVRSFRDGVLDFLVVNGAWFGRLHPDGRLEAFWPSGRIANTSTGAAVLYAGPVRGRDYNEIMAFMDRMLARNWLSRKFCVAHMNAASKVCGFWRRLRRSCVAFSNAWHGRSQYADETIPF